MKFFNFFSLKIHLHLLHASIPFVKPPTIVKVHIKQKSSPYSKYSTPDVSIEFVG